MTAPVYSKLPGKGYGLTGTATLWLAADHILNVRTGWLSEDYERFYLREIQATILREKPGLGVPLETIAICSLGLLLAAALATPWIGILLVIGASAYLVHKLRGPECLCFVKTATGTWQLPALTRLKQAQKTLAILKPAIESAQGGVSAAALVDNGALPSLAPPRAIGARVGHGWYVALLVSVLISAALGFSGAQFLSVVSTLSSGIVVVLALILLVRGSAEGAERNSTVLILALKSVKGCIGFVRPMWAGYTIAHANSVSQGIRMSDMLQNWQMLYRLLEVLLAMTAIAGFVNMTANRRSAPQTIFSDGLPTP